jgi:hypothetical protein
LRQHTTKISRTRPAEPAAATLGVDLPRRYRPCAM